MDEINNEVIMHHIEILQCYVADSRSQLDAAEVELHNAERKYNDAMDTYQYALKKLNAMLAKHQK